MEFIFAALFHALRFVVGKSRALAFVRGLLYRLASQAVRRAYDTAPGTVEEQVRHVYGGIAAEQQATIAREGRLVCVTVRDCQFANRFRRWGAEELTTALCEADRDYWQSRGALEFKSTRFEGFRDCVIDLRSD